MLTSATNAPSSAASRGFPDGISKGAASRNPRRGEEGGVNLEALLTHEQGFRLTNATPLQRAICRAQTGQPLDELAVLPAVIEAMGGILAIQELAKLQGVSPAVVVLLAAIRTAKSIIEAAKAFRATQICDLSSIREDEIACYSIVSLTKKTARAIFQHLTGALEMSPLLRSTVLKTTAESVFIRHPSGRLVEIVVCAGARAGGSLVARWSIGVSFDEAPRMQGQSDGIVNLPDALSSVRGRLLPGAQIGLPGSPWAPRGPIYDMFVDRFGRPGRDLLFMVAKGPDMNPDRYTPEFCRQLEADDPRAYRTDALALFADQEDSLLSSIDVQACTRAAPLHMNPVPGMEYVATLDPATRKNAWTLIVLCQPTPGRLQVAFHHQWLGSKSAPLRPKLVLQEIARLLEPYGVTDVWSDQASFDALRDLAADVGLSLFLDDFSESGWRTVARELEKQVSEHTLELPPDAALRSDLLGMMKKLTRLSWTIWLPTTNDGRHGDYAPALCLAVKHAPPAFVQVQSPADYDHLEQRVLEQLRARQSDPMRFAADQLARTFQ